MTAPSPEVPAHRTAEGLPRDAWIRSRHAAAFDAVRARVADEARAWRIATALMGHWSIEAGWGGGEWGFNVGNVKPGGAWRGPVQRLPDGLIYRAYDSLPAGAEDAVNLAAGTGTNPAYAPSWGYLLATGDGEGWYDRLMRAGWHPWSAEALATYRSTRARVAATVGDVPPVRASRLPALVAGVAIAAAAWMLARASRGS